MWHSPAFEWLVSPLSWTDFRIYFSCISYSIDFSSTRVFSTHIFALLLLFSPGVLFLWKLPHLRRDYLRSFWWSSAFLFWCGYLWSCWPISSPLKCQLLSLPRPGEGCSLVPICGWSPMAVRWSMSRLDFDCVDCHVSMAAWDSLNYYNFETSPRNYMAMSLNHNLTCCLHNYGIQFHLYHFHLWSGSNSWLNSAQILSRTMFYFYLQFPICLVKMFQNCCLRIFCVFSGSWQVALTYNSISFSFSSFIQNCPPILIWIYCAGIDRIQPCSADICCSPSILRYFGNFWRFSTFTEISPMIWYGSDGHFSFSYIWLSTRRKGWYPSCAFSDRWLMNFFGKSACILRCFQNSGRPIMD